MNNQLATEFFEAVKNRDTQYVGSFYFGVKTTGVFCNPGCTAKTPKPENLEFFLKLADAEQQGYRPCKLCQPNNISAIILPEVEKVLAILGSSKTQKLSNTDLKKIHVQPEKIRRWFRKYFGVTFQEFQRMRQMKIAAQMIANGSSILQVATEIGYQSLSGFETEFQKVFAQNPSQSISGDFFAMHYVFTPIGPMMAVTSDEGLGFLEFIDQKNFQASLKHWQQRQNGFFFVDQHPILTQTQKEITEYFDGKRKSFTVPLKMSGTDFQKKVWAEIQQIPYGQTISYAQQSVNLANPKAVRAVASANGKNKIAIIVPCHRIIGSDGCLTGYAGGIPRKKWLLAMERSA